MTLRTLGASDIRVSPIGLGCWQFSKGKGVVGRYWSVLGDDSIKDIVYASLNAGVNWFDTAEAYGWGVSETALAAALATIGKAPNDVVIATKWWPAFRAAGSIRATIDDRLDRLGGFPIDLYQVHQPYGFSSVEKEMDAMARLVQEKRIRYVGVSNFSAGQMKRADARLRSHGLRLIANQMRYSLLDRTIESNGVLEAAKELGISIIAYSPLAQGILTGKFHDEPGKVRGAGVRRFLSAFSRSGLERARPLVDALKEVASNHRATPSQVALQWVVGSHGDTVVAIPGATSALQAVENAGAMNILLTPLEVKKLNEASQRSSG